MQPLGERHDREREKNQECHVRSKIVHGFSKKPWTRDEDYHREQANRCCPVTRDKPVEEIKKKGCQKGYAYSVGRDVIQNVYLLIKYPAGDC